MSLEGDERIATEAQSLILINKKKCLSHIFIAFYTLIDDNDDEDDDIFCIAHYPSQQGRHYAVHLIVINYNQSIISDKRNGKSLVTSR